MKKVKIISGIYKIENIVNNKVYIGSTNNIIRRFREHKNSLKRGDHHSKHLQNAWNKYGEDNFDFSVIEECEVDRLLYVEQYYIDKYKSQLDGYNIKDKTKEMMTEIEYERYVMYKNYTDELNELLECDMLKFEDNKTLNRIKYSKYINNENVWYTDIAMYVNNTFGINKYCYIYITNVSYSEEDDKYITFDIKNKNLKFSVIKHRGDICYEYKFVYNIESRWIMFICSTEINKSEWIFDDYISRQLLGYLYDFNKIDLDEDRKMCIHRSKYTNEYFKCFIHNINPLSFEPIFLRYFENNEEMLNEIYKYHGKTNTLISRPCKEQYDLYYGDKYKLIAKELKEKYKVK